MKKLLLLLSAVIFVLCGCQSQKACAGSSYDVMVLGDLHFDGMEYHTSKAVTEARARERVRNCTMWKEATPKLLAAAAKQMNKDIPFVIQAGDFTQGDCDTFELHEKMIRDGFAKVKSYFPNHKLLPVRGNHDVRMLKGNSGTPTIRAFFPLIAVAVIYFILAAILTFIVNRIEIRIDPRRRSKQQILKGVKTDD